jgi:hypothetical protein
MNTQQELQEAFAELQRGTFIKKDDGSRQQGADSRVTQS